MSSASGSEGPHFKHLQSLLSNIIELEMMQDAGIFKIYNLHHIRHVGRDERKCHKEVLDIKIICKCHKPPIEVE